MMDMTVTSVIAISVGFWLLCTAGFSYSWILWSFLVLCGHQRYLHWKRNCATIKKDTFITIQQVQWTPENFLAVASVSWIISALDLSFWWIVPSALILAYKQRIIVHQQNCESLGRCARVTDSRLNTTDGAIIDDHVTLPVDLAMCPQETIESLSAALETLFRQQLATFPDIRTYFQQYPDKLKCKFLEMNWASPTLLIVSAAGWMLSALGVNYLWIFSSLILFAGRRRYASRTSREIPEDGNASCETEHAGGAFQNVQWLNQCLEYIWPSIKAWSEQWIATSLGLRFLHSYNITLVKTGTQPPTILGVKVYYTSGDESQLTLDFNIDYAGDAEIGLGELRLISNVKFKGTIRTVMKPRMNDVPFIGGLEMFFLQTPTINYEAALLGDVVNILSMGKLHDFIDKYVENFKTLRVSHHFASSK